MEIERKYLIDTLPEDYQDYPCRHIEQAYLNTDPVIRIRKDNNKHELTYKSKGLMAREEYNLPLTQEAQAECRFLLLSPNNLLKPSGSTFWATTEKRSSPCRICTFCLNWSRYHKIRPDEIRIDRHISLAGYGVVNTKRRIAP